MSWAFDDIDPSDRWDLDRERPVRNTDYTASIPAPEGAIIMQAIKPVVQLVLGDRLVVPGTKLSSPIRFLHRDDEQTTVEVETGACVVLDNDRGVRVVEAVAS